MAIYEYECEECRNVFLLTETISEHEKGDDEPACPECGSRKTHQLFSSFFAKTSSKS